MTRTFAMLGALVAAGSVSADDVSWQAAVPLWKSLSKTGQVVAAGPAPSWLGEKRDPPAKLGPPSRPAPEGLPRPQELPDFFTQIPGPQPASKPEKSAPAPKRAKEQFASFRIDGPTLPPPSPGR